MGPSRRLWPLLIVFVLGACREPAQWVDLLANPAATPDLCAPGDGVISCIDARWRAYRKDLGDTPPPRNVAGLLCEIRGCTARSAVKDNPPLNGPWLRACAVEKVNYTILAYPRPCDTAERLQWLLMSGVTR